MTAADLREKLEDERRRGLEVIREAYKEPAPTWPLRDLAAPLVLDLLDTARLALDALEELEAVRP